MLPGSPCGAIFYHHPEVAVITTEGKDSPLFARIKSEPCCLRQCLYIRENDSGASRNFINLKNCKYEK